MLRGVRLETVWAHLSGSPSCKPSAGSPSGPRLAPLHHERHRPEQSTQHQLLPQDAGSFIAHTEASTGAELPRFVKNDFDACLECGMVPHGFTRLRFSDCGHDKLLAFSCKRRAVCPSCRAANVVDGSALAGSRHPARTGMGMGAVAADPAARPTGRAARATYAGAGVGQRVVMRHLLDVADLTADEGGGAVTLIQRFGSAAKLNIHLHYLMLNGMYRHGTDDPLAFVEVDALTEDKLHALLQTVIAPFLEMVTRRRHVTIYEHRAMGTSLYLREQHFPNLYATVEAA